MRTLIKTGLEIQKRGYIKIKTNIDNRNHFLNLSNKKSDFYEFTRFYIS